MKFETILDATIAASIATTPYWYGNGERSSYNDEKSREYNLRKGRQCDVFRARLVKMYEELNYRKNWYGMWRDPLPRG